MSNVSEQIQQMTESSSGRIGTALQEELTKRQAEQDRRVAVAVADAVSESVSRLRQYRRMEREEKAKLDALNQAIEDYDSADNPSTDGFRKLGVYV